jgi:hypothetical protein
MLRDRLTKLSSGGENAPLIATLGSQKMISTDFAENALYDILEKRCESTPLIWSRTFGTNDLEADIWEEGTARYLALVTESSQCFLYGWIDQAVLEIKNSGNLTALVAEMKEYRPDQGGDCGVIAIDGHIAISLEMSFEDGSISIDQYKLPNKT